MKLYKVIFLIFIFNIFESKSQLILEEKIENLACEFDDLNNKALRRNSSKETKKNKKIKKLENYKKKLILAYFPK